MLLRSEQHANLQVVGPTDVGKSTLCRILLNYAVRSGWSPVMIDLDIGKAAACLFGIQDACPFAICGPTCLPVPPVYYLMS